VSLDKDKTMDNVQKHNTCTDYHPQNLLESIHFKTGYETLLSACNSVMAAFLFARLHRLAQGQDSIKFHSTSNSTEGRLCILLCIEQEFLICFQLVLTICNQHSWEPDRSVGIATR
jgi:hypothetical protein